MDLPSDGRWVGAFPTVSVLGFDVAATDLDAAAHALRTAALEDGPPLLVVTLNPEIVVRSRSDRRLKTALEGANLMVADGVGLLWAARREGFRLPGRVPGVELTCRLLELGGEDLSVYFLGGRPGVAARAAAEARRRWGTNVAGVQDGYFDDDQAKEIVLRIASSGAQLLLAGLGERQEVFLDDHRDALRARVLIGVGGTLDVLAGEAKRTPAWTRRLHLEWAWRVGLDRRRWHRIPRLVSFVRLVLRGDEAAR